MLFQETSEFVIVGSTALAFSPTQHKVCEESCLADTEHTSSECKVRGDNSPKAVRMSQVFPDLIQTRNGELLFRRARVRTGFSLCCKMDCDMSSRGLCSIPTRQFSTVSNRQVNIRCGLFGKTLQKIFPRRVVK